jgi:hypothetical protein
MSLLHAIEVCLRISNIPPSRFGRDSVRDPRLVHDLRRGRQPGRRMEQRVRTHIEQVLAARAAALQPTPQSIGPQSIAPQSSSRPSTRLSPQSACQSAPQSTIRSIRPLTGGPGAARRTI